WRAVREAHREAGALRGVVLLLDVRNVFVGFRVEVAGLPREPAVDAEALGERLHLVDRGAARLSDEPRAFLAEVRLDLRVPGVDHLGHVDRRAVRYAAPDRPRFEQDDLLACFGE